MAKKELNLGGLLNNVTARVDDAVRESAENQMINSGDSVKQQNNIITKQQKDATTKQQSNTQERYGLTRVKKIIPRINGCTYYFEDKDIEAIDRIKCFNKVDKQVVVRTALNLFLKKYLKEDGLGLTDEGIAEVEKYMYE